MDFLMMISCTPVKNSPYIFKRFMATNRKKTRNKCPQTFLMDALMLMKQK